MVQYNNRKLKSLAVSFRRKGLSFSEIRNRIEVPKATLSYWLKSIRLTQSQLLRLDRKRARAAKAGAKKKIAKVLEEIKKVQSSSAKDIKKISKRELWLIGIALYWRDKIKNSNKDTLKNGVRFYSSNPHLIKLFLMWLRQVGSLGKREIAFDIFISDNRKERVNKAVDYWARTIGFKKSYFKQIYLRKSRERSRFGALRIRVKASSLLAYQISGWIKGIINLTKE